MSGCMKLAMIGYAIVAIITFGYVADNPRGACGYRSCDAVDRIVVGLVSVTFWPLYWSWEAWS